jgi:pimeloyl-ACP methyl ester carboxylesterase
MTTWVLLRGLMREARHWGGFPLQFQAAVGTQAIVALDFPGNGSLHAQASASSVAEMANHCRTRLGQLGHAPPYRVLALSLGAMVAVAWDEMYPAELERLVLINTSLAPYSPFYHRLRPSNYPALVSLLPTPAARRESLIMRLTSNLKSLSEQRQQTLDQWVAYAVEYPVTRVNMLRQLYAAACYRAAPAAPSVPVLLLASRQDRLVDARCSLVLAQHWRCAIRLHPLAGHDLPLDDGGWVAQQVKDWLDDPAAAQRPSCNMNERFISPKLHIS